MAELVILVGMPGSGKTTYCRDELPNHFRISQDEMGGLYKVEFIKALKHNKNIVIDRQNFNNAQREMFLQEAKKYQYSIKAVVFRTKRELCERRIYTRKDHPTLPADSTAITGVLDRYAAQFQMPQKKDYDCIIEVTYPMLADIKDLSHLKGKIAIVGDLHGVRDELQELLSEHNPDYVVSTGDLVDRGPQIVELLRDFMQKDNYFCVSGNHEAKLLKYLNNKDINISDGIAVTIEQLKNVEAVEREMLRKWIILLPHIIKLPHNYVVVHGGFHPMKSLEKQKKEECLFIRSFKPGSSRLDDDSAPFWYQNTLSQSLQQYKILFGHNVHRDSYTVAPNIYALDGGAVFGGVLRMGILETETGKFEVYEKKCNTYYSKDR